MGPTALKRVPARVTKRDLAANRLGALGPDQYDRLLREVNARQRGGPLPSHVRHLAEDIAMGRVWTADTMLRYGASSPWEKPAMGQQGLYLGAALVGYDGLAPLADVDADPGPHRVYYLPTSMVVVGVEALEAAPERWHAHKLVAFLERQGINLADLNTNREGRLASSQRQPLVDAVFRRCLWLLFPVAFATVALIMTYAHAAMSMVVMAWALAGVSLAVAAWLLAPLVADLAQRRVDHAGGAVAIVNRRRRLGGSLRPHLALGGRVLAVPTSRPMQRALAAMREGDSFHVYFTPRSGIVVACEPASPDVKVSGVRPRVGPRF